MTSSWMKTIIVYLNNVHERTESYRIVIWTESHVDYNTSLRRSLCLYLHIAGIHDNCVLFAGDGGIWIGRGERGGAED